MRSFWIVKIFIAFLLLNACAPSRYVKPLKKDQQVVSASFGGPLIGFAGAVIPLPFTTVDYARGMTDNVTLHASLHPTSLLFGNIQSDIGATCSLYRRDSTAGISVSPAFQLAWHMGTSSSFRLWPSLDINYYQHFRHSPSYAYAGAGSWFEFSNSRANDLDISRHAIPGLQAGIVFNRKRVTHQVEIKYMALLSSSLPGVVDFKNINNRGAVGIYYGICWKFR